MARSTEFWIELRKAFDPEEVLVGQRSEAFYCEREYSPFDKICQDFDNALRPIRPPVAFFTGHRGSGKSSLLMRLLDRLKNDYFITYFDIHHNLDSRRANQIDLLYLLGATVFQVAVQEGIHPDPKNLKELGESVYTVTKTKKEAKQEALNVAELARGLLCFGAGLFGAKLGEKLAEAALKPFTITSGVSEETARKREIEPQVQDIVNNVR